MARRTLYTIDRFEDGDWAVLERDDGVTLNVPLWWLPDEAQEGHVLRLLTEGGTQTSTLIFGLDAPATQKKLREARELRESLPKGTKGDIDL